MISDRIKQAGLESYFQDPRTGRINLFGLINTIRTEPLNKGKQLELSGIQLLIEGPDMQPLMPFQFIVQNQQIKPSPIFKISVMKEMFPGLFADPFSNRVHNIAGFLDFNEGTLKNGRVMEIDGIPAIVSTNRKVCEWISKEYELPNEINITAIAWELATAKLVPPDSFEYKIKITSKDENGAILPDIKIPGAGGMLKADARRAIDGLNNPKVKSFQITFSALVFEDSYITERALSTLDENIGRPLLRAINILEEVPSIYEIHSLVELQNLCSDFHFFENPGPAISRLTANLDLNATLVNSPNQKIVNNDNYDPGSMYEFVELELFANQFSMFEAKRLGEILIRNTNY